MEMWKLDVFSISFRFRFVRHRFVCLGFKVKVSPKTTSFVSVGAYSEHVFQALRFVLFAAVYVTALCVLGSR